MRILERGAVLTKALLLLFFASLPSIEAIGDVSTSGFMTMVVEKSLDNDHTVIGISEDLSFSSSSLVGVQFESSISDKLSGAVQIVARGNENYELVVEWAYVDYEIRDNLNIQIGKVQIPFYLHSEYINVGYAYHWVKPPRNVYAIPFDSITGVRTVYDTSIAGWDVEFIGLIGGFDEPIKIQNTNLEVEASFESASFVTTATNGVFTLNAGYHSLHNVGLGFSLPIFEALDSGGWSSVADRLRVKDNDLAMSNIAMSFEYDNWFGGVEYRVVEVDESLMSMQKGFYYTIGKTWNKISLHATYSEQNNSASIKKYDFLPDDIPQQLAAAVKAVAKIQESDIETLTIGCRWDYTNNSSLKAEYYIEEDKLKNTDGVTAIRLSVDYVF